MSFRWIDYLDDEQETSSQIKTESNFGKVLNRRKFFKSVEWRKKRWTPFGLALHNTKDLTSILPDIKLNLVRCNSDNKQKIISKQIDGLISALCLQQRLEDTKLRIRRGEVLNISNRTTMDDSSGTTKLYIPPTHTNTINENTIWIGNIYEVTEEHVRALCGRFGDILRVIGKVENYDVPTRIYSGWVKITFKHHSSALEAFKALNNHPFNHTILHVEMARMIL